MCTSEGSRPPADEAVDSRRARIGYEHITKRFDATTTMNNQEVGETLTDFHTRNLFPTDQVQATDFNQADLATDREMHRRENRSEVRARSLPAGSQKRGQRNSDLAGVGSMGRVARLPQWDNFATRFTGRNCRKQAVGNSVDAPATSRRIPSEERTCPIGAKELHRSAALWRPDAG
jgi:hypothetical protein